MRTSDSADANVRELTLSGRSPCPTLLPVVIVGAGSSRTDAGLGQTTESPAEPTRISRLGSRKGFLDERSYSANGCQETISYSGPSDPLRLVEVNTQVFPLILSIKNVCRAANPEEKI